MAQHKFSPILRPHFDNRSLLYHNKNIITILQAPDNGDGDNPLSYSFFSLQKCMQRCGRQVHPAISTCSDAEWKTCLFSNIWLFCPSSFSDLRSPHTDMKHGLNTQINQVAQMRKKPEQNSFQHPTATCLFLKNQTWQTEVLSHLLLEKTERLQVHKAFSGPSEKSPPK